MNLTKYILLTLCFMSSALCSADTIKVENISYSASILKVGAGQPAIAVTDLNSDGNQDVIIANNSDNDIVTYLSNGNGTLTLAGDFPAGDSPSGLSASDINGDGNVDVVIANHETSYVTMLLGNGKGGFNPAPNSPLNVHVTPHPHAVRLNDLDGDNKVDLIVDNRNHEGLLVLKGHGNGDFKLPGKTIKVGGDPYRGFAIKDLNKDGHSDLVTPNQNDIGILINNKSGKGSFSLSRLAQSEVPFSIEAADVNGDGNMDLLVANNRNIITIIPGDGSGSFLKKKQIEIQASNGAKQIATGDLNGDDIDDALVSSWSGEVLILIGGPTIKSIKFKNLNTPNPWGVALLDLNKDGKSDFIVADGNSNLAAVYISRIE
ncbi:FG-GAP repeat domain-containing protein [Microbulbifer sp. PSTR4-B]|uniref:FG-GAP repeat domain-containing protein n=1 Tax=Microbulbifer sp. PSTR4-B TaxID=3243396 RepID=UPI0040393A31